MLEGNEVESVDTGSDVVDSPSSEGSSTNETQAPAQAVAKPEPETTPFHEHPRFKELVDQKNSYAKELEAFKAQSQAFQKELSSLRAAQPKAPSETDALIEDLKKIDPRLANAIASQMQAAETAKSLQERLNQFEQQSQENARQQTLQSAIGKINSLHETNKASDFAKQFINNQLDIAYRNGTLKASDLSAVEQAYGEASKSIKAYEEALKRSLTESYVKDKAKDAAVPTSQPKGAPAKSNPKAPQVPRDKDALRAAVVKSFMKEQAASRDATNT